MSVAPEAYAGMEGAHVPSDDRFWQESWYFNFADAAAGVYGLTRIGYRPATNRADGLFLALIDGRPAVLYPPVGLRLNGPSVAVADAGELRTRQLRYRCEAAMGAWHWDLQTRSLGVDLRYEAFTPPYRYPAPAVDDQHAAASDHYEQGGCVRGSLRVGARSWTIDGWGQRDHSWGPRHWSGVGRWLWISAQFPSGWCFNFWRVGEGPSATTCGFVGTAEGNIDIVGGELRWLGGRGDGRRPSGAELVLELADGSRREVRHASVGHFPLYKDGSVIQESFGTFVSGGETGVGVAEHLYRTPWRALAMLPVVPGHVRLALQSR